MKYKEEIQVITTINEFLRFHNQHYASYHENRSQKRRFIIRIYAGRRTFFNRIIFYRMTDIYKTIESSGKCWKSASL